MFKILKSKYQSSASWKDLFLSLAGLENVYERLDQAKTDKERVGILTEALEIQQNKLKELIEEIAKQDEQIEELENSLKKKDLEIEGLKKRNSLDKIRGMLTQTERGMDKLDKSIEETFALFEANPKK